MNLKSSMTPVMAAAAMLTACAGGGGAPTQATPTVRVTTAVDSMFPDSMAQYTATSTDGATSFTWSSSNLGVATVNSAGLVTATGIGSADICASHGGGRDCKAARVVPMPDPCQGGHTQMVDVRLRYHLAQREALTYLYPQLWICGDSTRAVASGDIIAVQDTGSTYIRTYKLPAGNSLPHLLRLLQCDGNSGECSNYVQPELSTDGVTWSAPTQQTDVRPPPVCNSWSHCPAGPFYELSLTLQGKLKL